MGPGTQNLGLPAPFDIKVIQELETFGYNLLNLCGLGARRKGSLGLGLASVGQERQKKLKELHPGIKAKPAIPLLSVNALWPYLVPRAAGQPHCFSPW